MAESPTSHLSRTHLCCLFPGCSPQAVWSRETPSIAPTAQMRPRDQVEPIMRGHNGRARAGHMTRGGPIRAFPGTRLSRKVSSFLFGFLTAGRSRGRQPPGPSAQAEDRGKETCQAKRIKDERKETGRERENELMAFDSLGPRDLWTCSGSCVLGSPVAFQLELGPSHWRSRLDSGVLPDSDAPPRPKERHSFISAPWKMRSFILHWEKGLAEPKTQFKPAPGQECPDCGVCVCVCVCAHARAGLGWARLLPGAGPSVYTARARPILLFSRSKTVKYNLRKTSPRIQESETNKLSPLSSKPL